MGHVDGGRLADLLYKEPKRGLSRVVEIFLKSTLGLRVIHDAGTIHRNLKPENILLTREGSVKEDQSGRTASSFVMRAALPAPKVI